MRTDSRELLAVGMCGGRSRIGERIETLLRRGRQFSPRASANAVIGSAVVLGCMMLAGALTPRWIAFAQQEPRPSFEVTSIKPSFSRRMSSVRLTPGRLTADATLPVLMQYAYGVEPFQIEGGPAGLMSTRYRIEATADATASRSQMLFMLRALLEERFRLKTHRDRSEQPVFALLPNRGGMKLSPPKEGACVDSAVDAASEWAGSGRMAVPGEAPDAKPRCGAAVVTLGPGGAQIKGGRITMPELARTLSMLLGRGVVDRTGFGGVFDLDLTFVPDETTPSVPPPPPGSGVSDLSGAALAQGLQQLGLRLESARAPVETLVVDHVEKPDAN